MRRSTLLLPLDVPGCVTPPPLCVDGLVVRVTVQPAAQPSHAITQINANVPEASAECVLRRRSWKLEI